MSNADGCRVYLGRIPLDIKEREIEKFFKNYGPVKNVNIKTGFAFLEFDDKRDAEDAAYDLDGKEFLGGRVAVEIAKGIDRRVERDRNGSYGREYGGGSSSRGGGRSEFERPYNTQYRVTVKGLSTRTNWRDLKDYFRRIGEVTFADAHRHKEGEGIVDFKSRSEMEEAVRKMDDTDLDGRRVRVIAATSSRSRSRSPRARRSPSRSPAKRSRSPAKGSRTRSMSR